MRQGRNRKTISLPTEEERFRASKQCPKPLRPGWDRDQGLGEWPLEKGYSVKEALEVFHILLEAGLSVEVKVVMGLKRQRQGDCCELKDI